MMETLSEIPVQFSASALKELGRLMSLETHDHKQSLRIGVKGGGCSGLSYVLGFDDPQESDVKFEIEGIPCVMNKAHEIYLYGMLIDWDEGLNNRGFAFKNPNASSTCGCGTSFAV